MTREALKLRAIQAVKLSQFCYPSAVGLVIERRDLIVSKIGKSAEEGRQALKSLERHHQVRPQEAEE